MRASVRPCLALAISAVLVALATADTGSSAQVAKPVEGGTFRIALNVVPGGVDSIDPALEASAKKTMILRPTCAQLMASPGPRPEVAAGQSPPLDASGTFTYTSSTFNSVREAGGNVIIDLSATVSYTGTLTGTSTLHGTLTLHANGTANFQDFETFNGTVNGVPGTVEFRLQGTTDMAA